MGAYFGIYVGKAIRVKETRSGWFFKCEDNNKASSRVLDALETREDRKISAAHIFT